jgi:hypothetical protein
MSFDLLYLFNNFVSSNVSRFQNRLVLYGGAADTSERKLADSGIGQRDDFFKLDHTKKLNFTNNCNGFTIGGILYNKGKEIVEYNSPMYTYKLCIVQPIHLKHSEIDLNCQYAMKTILINDIHDNYNSFKNESQIAKRASDKGYGPKIDDNFADFNGCTDKENTKGVIIMELYDGSLYNLIESIPYLNKKENGSKKGNANILLKNNIKNGLIILIEKINKMHDDGIFHQDLYTKNCLYKKNKDNSYDMTPMDFGVSISFGKSLSPLLRAVDYATLLYGINTGTGTYHFKIPNDFIEYIFDDILKNIDNPREKALDTLKIAFKYCFSNTDSKFKDNGILEHWSTKLPDRRPVYIEILKNLKDHWYLRYFNDYMIWYNKDHSSPILTHEDNNLIDMFISKQLVDQNKEKLSDEKYEELKNILIELLQTSQDNKKTILTKYNKEDNPYFLTEKD